MSDEFEKVTCSEVNGKQVCKSKYEEIFERIAKENNINFEYHFKGNVGRAFQDERKVWVSKPINRDRLQVALHELCHILIGNIKPRYKEELEAEKCSFKMMRENNIPVSRKATERSKHYIAIKTQQAGLKEVSGDVKKFIEKDYPETAKGEHRFV
jgi:hypothetical protein